MTVHTFTYEYTVQVETSPPEPDVNWPGSADIISVDLNLPAVNGKHLPDLIECLTPEYLVALEEQVNISAAERAQDDYDEYCDYMYEQQKDRFLERRYEALDRAEREVSRAD